MSTGKGRHAVVENQRPKPWAGASCVQFPGKLIAHDVVAIGRRSMLNKQRKSGIGARNEGDQLELPDRHGYSGYTQIADLAGENDFSAFFDQVPTAREMGGGWIFGVQGPDILQNDFHTLAGGGFPIAPT